MPHPATVRAVSRAIEALAVPLDMGFVFPPLPGETRGKGIWQKRDLDTAEVLRLLPRAAAANARGASIYMRAREAADGHTGLVLLDDLTKERLVELEKSGFDPALVVQTSPRNYQGWIRLVPHSVTLDRNVVQIALRRLIAEFGADPRAASPSQPGRVPGFTNQKPKYRASNGLFPFVKIVEARPGMVARAGQELLNEVTNELSAQGGARTRRFPETEAVARHTNNPTIAARLDAIRASEAQRIADQVAAGSRPIPNGSRSEIDFAVVVKALAADIDAAEISAWLARTRPDKDNSYPSRTVNAGLTYLASRRRAPILAEKNRGGPLELQ